MNDLGLAAMWTAVLTAAVATVFALHARGLATHRARDMLHIGAGVWVLGWPWWNGVVAPIAICACALLVLAAVPAVAPHVRGVAAVRHSVADEDERFAGLVVYALSFAVFTFIGLVFDPFPAAAALLALSLGDGVGGAVGRRFGTHRYQTMLGKAKSIEGTAAVAAAAMVGVVVAAALFDVELPIWRVAALGIVAALAEGVAPRSSDNLLVPAAVWAAAEVMS